METPNQRIVRSLTAEDLSNGALLCGWMFKKGPHSLEYKKRDISLMTALPFIGSMTNSQRFQMDNF